jgi:hypothetical protein
MRKRTVHVFALNLYEGNPDVRSHMEGRVINFTDLPLSTEVSHSGIGWGDIHQALQDARRERSVERPRDGKRATLTTDPPHYGNTEELSSFHFFTDAFLT